MDPDRLHISWDKMQNTQELERITESLQAHFPEYRFCIRMILTQPRPGRSQADISFYIEGEEEDRKICTVSHIIGSYIAIRNLIAAIRGALQK